MKVELVKVERVQEFKWLRYGASVRHALMERNNDNPEYWRVIEFLDNPGVRVDGWFLEADFIFDSKLDALNKAIAQEIENLRQYAELRQADIERLKRQRDELIEGLR